MGFFDLQQMPIKFQTKLENLRNKIQKKRGKSSGQPQHFRGGRYLAWLAVLILVGGGAVFLGRYAYYHDKNDSKGKKFLASRRNHLKKKQTNKANFRQCFQSFREDKTTSKGQVSTKLSDDSGYDQPEEVSTAKPVKVLANSYLQIPGFEALPTLDPKYPEYRHERTGMLMLLFGRKKTGDYEAFLLSKFPILQKEWYQIMDGTPSNPYLPVTTASPQELVEFYQKSQLEIPTDHQIQQAFTEASPLRNIVIRGYRCVKNVTTSIR